ncbi:MAG: hypothetical protein IJR95_09880 [Lachnospiraceae bacterium]|nr:hypothetical protein [Lachnospiraceae bacterium]
MQENGTLRETPVERSLSDMYWSLLGHWKIILLVALLAALALGGISFYKNYKVLKDPKTVEKQETDYRTALENYEKQKTNLEKRLQNLEDEQVRLEGYSNTAIMLFADQYNIYEHTASYYVNTNYEIAPELFFQNPNYTSVITNSYRAAINRLDLDEVISGGQETKLTCQNPITDDALRLVTTSVDASNGILNFTVYGDTKERVDQIVSAIRRVLADQEALLNQVIGEHSLDVLSQEDRTTINTDFGRMQTAFETKTESVANGIKTTTDKLNALEAPVNEAPSLKKLIVSVLKKAVLGLVGGLAAALLFLAALNIFRDRVVSAGELRNRYHCPVLGAYNFRNQEANWNCRILNKLGMPHMDSGEAALDLVAANVRYYMKDAEKLLLIGTEQEENIASLKKALESRLKGIDIQLGGNVNLNPAAVAALEGEAAIICVERYNKSAHKEIRKEMQLLRAFGDRNVGFILTNG